MEVKGSGGELGRSAETIFYPGTVAIATHTLYPRWYPGRLRAIGSTDKVRGDLALETFRAAIQNGYHLVVADGGSSQEFKDEVLKIGGNLQLIYAEGGRGPQRRQAFKTSTAIDGVRVVVYTQPEKVGLIKDFVPQLAVPIIANQADIVIPERDPELFQRSYPGYMYESEILVNKRYNQILSGRGILQEGQQFDWFFGPIVFKNDPAILKLFLKRYKFVKPQGKLNIDKYANPENRSNAHYFPVIEALHKGLRVKSVEVPFVYPPEQRDNETFPARKEDFVKRRKTDRFGYWAELIQFVRYLEKNPRKKSKLGLRKAKH